MCFLLVTSFISVDVVQPGFEKFEMTQNIIAEGIILLILLCCLEIYIINAYITAFRHWESLLQLQFAILCCSWLRVCCYLSNW